MLLVSLLLVFFFFQYGKYLTDFFFLIAYLRRGGFTLSILILAVDAARFGITDSHSRNGTQVLNLFISAAVKF